MSEHDEQCALFEWAHLLEVQHPPLRWLFAIPNGGKLPYTRDRTGRVFSKQRLWMVKEGMRSGVADICLPYPSADGQYHALYIEMKWGKNKTTKEQEEFLAAMRQAGNRAEICIGAESAMKVILEYLEVVP